MRRTTWWHSMTSPHVRRARCRWLPVSAVEVLEDRMVLTDAPAPWELNPNPAIVCDDLPISYVAHGVMPSLPAIDCWPLIRPSEPAEIRNLILPPEPMEILDLPEDFHWYPCFEPDQPDLSQLRIDPELVPIEWLLGPDLVIWADPLDCGTYPTYPFVEFLPVEISNEPSSGDVNPSFNEVAESERRLVDYGSDGWRYRQVEVGERDGFESGSEPEGFADGVAGFGNLAEEGLVCRSLWSLETDLLLRREVTLDAGESLKIAVAIDNDVEVLVNGVEISGGMAESEFVAVHDRFVFEVPSGIVHAGSNLVAIRARDRGCANFFDARIVAVDRAAAGNVNDPNDPSNFGIQTPPDDGDNGSSQETVESIPLEPETLERPLLDYGSDGWRFLQVEVGALDGFESGSEPEGFEFGQAGFGDLAEEGLTCHTPWSLETDMLLRREVTLEAGESLKVAVAIDNDVQVWVNGVEISGGMVQSEDVAVHDRYVFLASTDIVHEGPNLVAIRARDRGGANFIDARLAAVSNGSAPMPLPMPGPIDNDEPENAPEKEQLIEASSSTDTLADEALATENDVIAVQQPDTPTTDSTTDSAEEDSSQPVELEVAFLETDSWIDSLE